MEDLKTAVAATARPGDTVIVGFSEQLTEAEIEAARQHFEGLAEQGITVHFACPVSGIAVVRGDRDAA